MCPFCPAKSYKGQSESLGSGEPESSGCYQSDWSKLTCELNLKLSGQLLSGNRLTSMPASILRGSQG